MKFHISQKKSVFSVVSPLGMTVIFQSGEIVLAGEAIFINSEPILLSKRIDDKSFRSSMAISDYNNYKLRDNAF